jgi:hypothetical protein
MQSLGILAACTIAYASVQLRSRVRSRMSRAKQKPQLFFMNLLADTSDSAFKHFTPEEEHRDCRCGYLFVLHHCKTIRW